MAMLLWAAGPAPESAAAGPYEETAARAIAKYRNASNYFHNLREHALIIRSIDDFRPHWAAADRLAVKSPSSPALIAEGRTILASLAERRQTLAEAIANAARLDNLKIAVMPAPSQPPARQKAQIQQAADQAILAEFDAIIRQIREDLRVRFNTHM